MVVMAMAIATAAPPGVKLQNLFLGVEVAPFLFLVSSQAESIAAPHFAAVSTAVISRAAASAAY